MPTTVFPKRPALIRSQSDTTSSRDILASNTSALSSPSFLETNPNSRSHGYDVSSNRPPRNPARSGPDLPVSIHIASPTPVRPARKLAVKGGRPKTATGTREEVTPWELYPPPESYGKEAPKSAVIGESTNLQRNVTVSSSGRPLSHGISFADISLLRRRKTTGSKVAKPKGPAPHVLQKPRAVSGGSPISQQLNHLARPSDVKAAPATPRVLQKSSTTPRDGSSHPESSFSYHQTRGLPIAVQSALGKSPSSLVTNSSLHKSPSQASSDHHNNLKFSTADRTILEELKRNIQARASQFVMKGGHCSQPTGGPNSSDMDVASTYAIGRLGGVGGVRRHHPYPKKQAPYPRSYERGVLDLDVWETLFCQQVCGGLTWHDFKTPPTKVLEIGCGTGSWILDCARAWKNCHFVGLDLVPLHPDLIQVGSMDMAQRITWVQDNFLDGLPFPNEEFDFVHIKRIALGVPEDKWDFLFEEIVRVMKPGGAFEMIEEDLFFPGRLVGDDADDEPASRLSDESQQSAFRTSVKRNTGQSTSQRLSGIPLDSDLGSDLEHDHDSESLFTSSAGSHHTSSIGGRLSSEDVGSPHASSATSTGSGHLFAPAGNKSQILSASPRSASPLPIDAIVEDDEGERRADLPTPPEDSGHDRFATNHTITQASVAKTSRSDSGHAKSPVTKIGTVGVPSKPVVPPLHMRSATSAVPSNSYHLGSPFPSRSPSQPRHSTSMISLHSPIASTRPSSGDISSIIRKSTDASARTRPSSANSGTPTSISPFLLRSLPKPPVNPRDHSLLELIYNETAASRFINLTPLSLLPNLLNVHFKDVRTHPTLQFTFPPRTESQRQPTSHYIDDPDEEAQDAVHPVPATTSAPPSRARRHSTAAAQRYALPGSSTESFRSLDNLNGDDFNKPNFVSIQSLIQGTSPYISLDESRPSAFSPSSRATFPKTPPPSNAMGLSLSMEHIQTYNENMTTDSQTMSPNSPKTSPFLVSASMLQNRLPNKTLNVDLRSLNLHLLARVSEILACSESMWEWVVEYQEKAENTKTVKAQRARSKSVGAVQPIIGNRSVVENQEDRQTAALLALTREDFEKLLLWFYM
ncbi:hypothetical protein Moror_13607 [Moniliophthora roreri MCA 2997]|nr:hypothetical protein Moror_13607 [Moniliophthora roreri MCA 2997]